jgi:opacity protein-like surface antigen
MRLGLVLAAVLLSTTSAHAQDQPVRPWGLWVMPTIGSYSENGCAGLCAGSSVAFPVTWQPSRLALTARAAAAQDDQEIWHVKDIGVVAGYGTRPGGVFHAHAGIGLGYGESSASAKSGLTIPFEAQVAWRPLPFLGLGLYGWGNTTGPLGGVGAGVQIGKLR